MSPLHPNEKDRLDALHALDVIGSAPEPQYDAVCRIAQTLFDAPVAYVSLVDERRQWLKAKCGLTLDGTPREESFCTYAILSEDVLVVEDARTDERFSALPLVAGEAGVRFYAGAPLVLGPGLNVGSLCVLDRRPRTFSAEQREQLQDLAKVVVAYLRAWRDARTARENAQRYHQVLATAQDAFVSMDAAGRITHWNPAAEATFGWSAAEVLGRCLAETIVPPGHRAAHARGVERYLQTRRGDVLGKQRFELAALRRDGTEFPVEVALSLDTAGGVTTFNAFLRDISQRKETEARLAHIARHDPLTGLPNRLLFRERLEQEIARSGRSGGFALLCLDLDRFKRVNDTLGHQAGDSLLCAVADRIRSELRIDDVAARLGGDEFVVLRGANGRPEEAICLARRLITAMASPVHLDGYPTGIGISIGIALAPSDAADPDLLYARADQALYRAKAAGRNTYCLHGHEPAHRESPAVGAGAGERRHRHADNSSSTVEERYRLALLATEDAIWDYDLVSDHIVWSEATRRLFGYDGIEHETSGAWWKSKIHPEDRARVLASFEEALDGDQCRWIAEYRFARGDGGYAEVIDRGFAIRDRWGRAVRMIGAMHDVTEKRRSDAALRASEERLRLALRAGRMVAWEQNLVTGQSLRSESAIELLGIGSGPTTAFLDHVHPDERAEIRAAFGGAEAYVHREFRYVTPSGRTLWLSAWAERVDDERVVGVSCDITERKLAEEQAWRSANHDALTGLPNRRLFQERLEQALEQAGREGSSVSLLLVDLDDFKDVNDSLGHDSGDAVLVEAAHRLGEGLRAEDTLARLGSDEFALIVVEPLRLEHAVGHAKALIERLAQPFRHREHRLACKASIGIAAHPDHDHAARDLLKDADIALYRAKAEGRSRAVVFTPALRAEAERRLAVAGEIRAALEAGQIVPFYQPKVCLARCTVVGFEALARWRHPEKGLLTPGYFGSAFDEPELATAIGESVLRQVATDLRAWQDRGLASGRVAVNLASAEFRKPDLAGGILAVLEEHGVPAGSLEVEVTETVFLGHGSEAVPLMLQQLDEAGVLITLDDFGTGFASLTHLKQFPVGHIKVDQSFVRDMERDHDDAAIVAAVIGLGRNLGMQVTAEGVETAGQAERLLAMGCNYAQGYHYAKPMAGSRVPRFLMDRQAVRKGRGLTRRSG
ncbi:diguanylate cyclase [Methylobacterium radiodurans]|uniref:Diguanylate cyclase n=2 Tax=Methylobacterium radiodurans TaxID=2202828 RepID=A0A2U8VWJ3_9HYPH|nr:diguanylate cyclase [Methylobacterium radiodurans]